jgi:tetratricopeptide (TPR) repeat protein
VQARITRIDALMAKNDLGAALGEATRVAANTSNLPQPYMQLGRIYMKQGNYQAAEPAFLQAAKLSNDAYDAVGSVIDARIALGKLPEARALVDSALTSQPKNAWLHIYKARIAKASRDQSGAERALQDALTLDESNLEAYLELTRLYAEAGRLDEVRTQLEAIVTRQPRAVWAHTMIAISFELQNRKKEARERYQKVLDIDPRAAIAANNLAMIYVTEGQNLNAALQLAQTAVQQLPESPETNDTLGSVYMKQDLPALAVAPFGLSVRKDPRNPLFHYHLGLALAQSGEKLKARTALQQALSLGKDFEGEADAKRVLATLR